MYKVIVCLLSIVVHNLGNHATSSVWIAQEGSKTQQIEWQPGGDVKITDTGFSHWVPTR